MHMCGTMRSHIRRLQDTMNFQDARVGRSLMELPVKNIQYEYACHHVRRTQSAVCIPAHMDRRLHCNADNKGNVEVMVLRAVLR